MTPSAYAPYRLRDKLVGWVIDPAVLVVGKCWVQSTQPTNYGSWLYRRQVGGACRLHVSRRCPTIHSIRFRFADRPDSHIEHHMNNLSPDGAKVRSRKRWRYVVCALAFLVPFKVTIVPEWRLVVVDEGGSPMQAIGVRQSWQHYTLEAEGHEDDARTDASGVVVFPERSTWANGLRFVVGAIKSAEAGVHAGFGPSAFIMTLAGPCFGGSVDYEGAEPLPDTLVMRPSGTARCRKEK